MQATNPDLNPDDASPDYTDSDSDDVDFDAKEGEANGAAEFKDEIDDEADDGSQLPFVEDSDNDDLIDIDDVEIPGGLLEYGSESDSHSEIGAADGADAEWDGFRGESKMGTKRKRGKDAAKEKKKRIRSLPTFATYEDYAKLIEDGPEDDI